MGGSRGRESALEFLRACQKSGWSGRPADRNETGQRREDQAQALHWLVADRGRATAGWFADEICAD